MGRGGGGFFAEGREEWKAGMESSWERRSGLRGEFWRGGNGIPAEKTELVEEVEEGGGEAEIKFPRKGRNGGREWNSLGRNGTRRRVDFIVFAFLNKIMYFCSDFKMNVYVA